MKDIRLALRSFLLADAAVNALVGGSRIHYARLPQNQVEPSVVFVKIAEAGDYNMGNDSGLSQVRMQFDSWAQSSDVATELANAVYDRLTGARGLIDYGSDSLDIRGIFSVTIRDNYDDINRLYSVTREFVIWYAGSAVTTDTADFVVQDDGQFVTQDNGEQIGSSS